MKSKGKDNVKRKMQLLVVSPNPVKASASAASGRKERMEIAIALLTLQGPASLMWPNAARKIQDNHRRYSVPPHGCMFTNV